MQKKASILALYEILNTYSDELHPLQRSDIDRYLDMEYQITIDRKTLRDHIELLNAFGCDIQTPSNLANGYYLGSRLFESSEVHLLCNTIYASHFIHDKASKDLIKKLLSTQSKYIKQDFDQTIYMRNMRKSLNKEFFLNIEVLIEAMQENHPIAFHYMKYNINKQLVSRKDHEYILHPYYFVYANENYYLICKNDDYENLSHYRIDKMQDIRILHNQTRKPLGKAFDPYAYAKSKIYMYGGESERITLKCNYVILDDMIDRFGNDVILQPCDEHHFLAIVNSSTQGIMFLCLQYLKYCEVTSPKSLRDKISAVLKEALSSYETNK